MPRGILSRFIMPMALPERKRIRIRSEITVSLLLPKQDLPTEPPTPSTSPAPQESTRQPAQENIEHPLAPFNLRKASTRNLKAGANEKEIAKVLHSFQQNPPELREDLFAQVLQDQPASDPETNRGFEADSTSSSSARVNESQSEIKLSIVGGQLMMASEDEQALDQLEQMIELLSRTLTQQRKWSVFYLRAGRCR